MNPESTDTLDLRALFDEIHWLSAELKRETISGHHDQGIMVAARGLLQTLHEQGPQTVPAVARFRNSSRQNVQIMANRLERMGCIEFVPNPRHKLSELLRLIEKGRELLVASGDSEARLLARVETHFPNDEAKAALDHLRRLRLALTGTTDIVSVPVSPSEVRPEVTRETETLSLPRPRKAVPMEIDEDLSADEGLPVNLL